MKRHVLILAATLVLSTASSLVLAETPKYTGPEIITFKMGTKSLAFEHKKHLASLNNECFHCHKTEKGKIDGWGKDTAHMICIPCHDLYDKGPVDCKGCHTK